MAGDAEVFVPGQISLADFRGLIYCDAEASDYWLPLVREAVQEAPEGFEAPPGPIQVGIRSVMRFRFPGDFTPSRRIRQ